MNSNSPSGRVAETMRRINEAWRDGRVDDMVPLIHEDMVMVLPGFDGRVEGRDVFLEGYRDFCANAQVLEFVEDPYEIDAGDRVAVVSYTYAMLYERDGTRARTAGRDLWVFENTDGKWVAAWRTMLDVSESVED